MSIQAQSSKEADEPTGKRRKHHVMDMVEMVYPYSSTLKSQASSLNAANSQWPEAKTCKQGGYGDTGDTGINPVFFILCSLFSVLKSATEPPRHREPEVRFRPRRQ
jgi:hypothetical protein